MSANLDLYDSMITHAADTRLHENQLGVELGRIVRRHEDRLDKLVATGASNKKILSEVSRFRTEVFRFKKSALDEIIDSGLDYNQNALSRVIGKVFKVKKGGRTGFLNKLLGSGVISNKNLEQQIGSIVSQQEGRINTMLKKFVDSPTSLRRAEMAKVTRLTQGQLDTLLTTSITQAEAETLRATAEANPELIQGLRFTAVLDANTTQICQHHDGKVYDVKDKRFVPPLHWNCRSVMVPVVASRGELEDTKGVSKAELAKKDADYFNGFPPAVEDYDTWLRRQPVEVQLRHLDGDEDKLAIFQSGKLKLSQFTTSKGKGIDASTLRRLNNHASFSAPVHQSKYSPATGHYHVVEATTIAELITSKKARQQLRQLFIMDADNTVSPLSTTDYKGVLKDTKRANRIKANTAPEDSFYFDSVDGTKHNPWIYRQNNEVLEERVKLVRESTLLNKEQKDWIIDFQDSLSDSISTNQRSVVIDNLRVSFERQLRVSDDKFATKWENLTAVVRAENVNAVKNVSDRLNVTERRRSKLFNKIKPSTDPEEKAKISILGETEKTFDDISRDLARNQRYVDDWRDEQGLKLAHEIYFKGKLPLKGYFKIPLQSSDFEFKKQVVKSLDKAIDTANISKRFKESYKEVIDYISRNPLHIIEDAYISLARELDVAWTSILHREFRARRQNNSFRQRFNSKLPEQHQKAIKATAAALEELAKGNAADYDSLAINIGKRLQRELGDDLPLTKSSIKDHHRNGSRILQYLEKQGKIKVSQAVKTRKAATDLSSGKPQVGGWKETLQREIEIIDPEIKRRQVVDRELYVGRRIGITEKKDKLFIYSGEINYRSKLPSKKFQRAKFERQDAKREFDRLDRELKKAQAQKAITEKQAKLVKANADASNKELRKRWNSHVDELSTANNKAKQEYSLAKSELTAAKTAKDRLDAQYKAGRLSDADIRTLMPRSIERISKAQATVETSDANFKATSDSLKSAKSTQLNSYSAETVKFDTSDIEARHAVAKAKLDNANKAYKEATEKVGEITSEKVITKSAASELGLDESTMARHIDRDFANQLNYANDQEWALDNEFSKWMEGVTYYKPRSDRKGPTTPNLYNELISQRGEQGTMLFQSMKWHRQNGTKWSNLHQFDGRGRFYEQGYLAATRGELVRPYLEAPIKRQIDSNTIREVAIQIGATVGDGDLQLIQQGRFKNFLDHLDDVLDLGHSIQGKYNQKNRNIEDFLNNPLITHVDDVGDAAEIGKIARYALEIKRIEDHLNKNGLTLRQGKSNSVDISEWWNLTEFNKRPRSVDKALKGYKTGLNVENDASASGAQQIAIASKDLALARSTNVVPTDRKQRLYDIAAMRAIASPKLAKYRDELGLTWKDLQKAAKQQNMVAFYGAGDLTKANAVETKFAKVLFKETDQIVVYKDKIPGDFADSDRVFSQSGLNAQLDRAINDAENNGFLHEAANIREVKVELNNSLNKNAPWGAKLMKYADESDDDVALFVSKATNGRTGTITPRDFEVISEVMSGELAKIAPSTKTFIEFHKENAKTYVPVAGTTDIQWVNYRGKQLTQTYRPVNEELISWKDEITGKTVTNVYRDTVEDGLLRSAASVGDVSTGLGVNGNHMNDGSLVQGYWLRARKGKKRVASIHDGFFSHVDDAEWTKRTLYELMADAVDSDVIKKTLKAQKDAALKNVNRDVRRERQKIIDKLVERLDRNQLTKEDINNSFAIIPNLKETLMAELKMDSRQLSRALGSIHKRNQLQKVKDGINDNKPNVGSLNNAIKDSPALERALVKEFNMGKNQILNEFAKHSNLTRIKRQQQQFKDGTLEDYHFFKNNFQEPSLRDVEKAKYAAAVKKARNAGKPIPEPSEVLGKKPSPQEVMRKRYGIKDEKDFQKKVAAGEFNFGEFFEQEITRNQGGLDLKRVKQVVDNVFDADDPDLDIVQLSKAFRKHRKRMRRIQSKEVRDINEWYEKRLARARELQLIDKNKTNAVKLKRLDALEKKLKSSPSFNQTQLNQFYEAWKDDLEQFYGIHNFSELNNKYRAGNFPMDEFLYESNGRYRELTRQDMLRELQSGEDLYGIGP